MILSLLMIAQIANIAAFTSAPLNEVHVRGLGCVATLGMIADEQRRGKASSLRFPNIMVRGKTYAGNVGLRVMDETGQPREAIAALVKQSVEAQTAEIAAAGDFKERREIIDARMAACLPLLDAEVPPAAPTPDDYRFCAAIIGLAADEIEGREGTGSMNAKMMRGLSGQLSGKYRIAQYGDAPGTESGALADIKKEKETQTALAKAGGGLEALPEKEGEEKYQRCIFLGE